MKNILYTVTVFSSIGKSEHHFHTKSSAMNFARKYFKIEKVYRVIVKDSSGDEILRYE